MQDMEEENKTFERQATDSPSAPYRYSEELSMDLTRLGEDESPQQATALGLSIDMDLTRAQGRIVSTLASPQNPTEDQTSEDMNLTVSHGALIQVQICCNLPCVSTSFH